MKKTTTIPVAINRATGGLFPANANAADSLPVQTAGSLEEAKAAGRVLYGRVTRNSRQVYYGFSIAARRLEVAHDFRTPWYAPWISRWAGTWIGGEDNSPGEFGGRASQDMKLWLKRQAL